MSTQNSLSDYFKDLADAIRSVTGITDKISPQDFADLIRSFYGIDGSFHVINKLIGQTVLGIGESHQYQFVNGTPDLVAMFSVASAEVSSVFKPEAFSSELLNIQGMTQTLIPGNAINTTSVIINDEGLLTVTADTSRQSSIIENNVIFVLFLHIHEDGTYDYDFDCVTVPIRLSFLSTADIVANSSKQSNYVAEDTEDGYLQITFNGPKNNGNGNGNGNNNDDTTNADGFYFQNYSYSRNTTYYDLYVEDYEVIAPSGLTDANWGFYNGSSGGLFSSGSYTMVSKNDLRTTDAFWGIAQSGRVQFNVSSSYNGEFPLIIKLRANIIYK